MAVALICALAGGAAFAKDGNECIAGAGAVGADFVMPNVAQAIAKKKLDITVVGSASSELKGSTGASIAYPIRLQAASSQASTARAETPLGSAS